MDDKTSGACLTAPGSHASHHAPSDHGPSGFDPSREDVAELANAIVVAWEQSNHDFPVTYPHQLQMALIAARFLVEIASDSDGSGEAGVTGTGTTEGNSAGAKHIARPSSEQSS